MPRSSLPLKDADISTVSKTVAAKWATMPQFTLLWITQAQFAAAAAAFSAALGDRQSTGSNRPSQKHTLGRLEKEMDKGISALKIDLQKTFGKEAAFAHYSRYGLEHRSNGYVLPKDRDQRLAAIRLIPAALLADGINGAPYDSAFWMGMIASYSMETDKVVDMSGAVSAFVSAKNQQRAVLLKAMRALQLLLQANYPNSFRAVFREWGWQKEDY